MRRSQFDRGSQPVRNLLLNPSSETLSGAVSTVRTNWCKNPSLEVNTSDWFGNAATISRTTAEFYSGTASLAVLTNGTSGSGCYKDANGIAGSGWTAGDPCSATVWIKAPAGTAMASSLVCLGGATGSPLVTWTASGTWEKITMINGVLPAGATSVPYVFVRVNGVHTALTFYADELLIDKATVPGNYFDGSTAAAGDFTYAWTSTAYASNSIQRADVIANTVAVTGVTAAQSSEWSLSGTKSLRLIPTGQTTTTFAYWSLPTVIGQTYTLLATARLSAPLSGTLEGRSRRLMIRSGGDSFSAIPANVAGVTPLRVSHKVQTTTTTFYCFSGASQGNGDVWWDDLMVVEGDYQGPYIDGTKPFSKWDGTPHASTSVGYPS